MLKSIRKKRQERMDLEFKERQEWRHTQIKLQAEHREREFRERLVIAMCGQPPSTIEKMYKFILTGQFE